MGLMGARVIGIDVGTSGVRAAALADDGATVGSAAVAMDGFRRRNGSRDMVELRSRGHL